jgi:hypothetical protein
VRAFSPRSIPKPEKTIRSALTQSGKSSIRERDLPAHVVMYYVIAQALFMLLLYLGFVHEPDGQVNVPI